MHAAWAHVCFSWTNGILENHAFLFFCLEHAKFVSILKFHKVIYAVSSEYFNFKILTQLVGGVPIYVRWWKFTRVSSMAIYLRRCWKKNRYLSATWQLAPRRWLLPYACARTQVIYHIGHMQVIVRAGTPIAIHFNLRESRVDMASLRLPFW